MGENSKIEWCDHTFNPWTGCEKISPACDHCYAESWSRRAGHPELWHGERKRTSAANWRFPLKWNQMAAERGIRMKVFCASLADVFDNKAPEEWRRDLFELIRATPHLDWLLLTKRIGNAAKMLPEGFADAPWPNVWIGSTICNTREAERDIIKLAETPAAVRFLSMEPLIEAVDLSMLEVSGRSSLYSPLTGRYVNMVGDNRPEQKPRIDWVIVGGESGSKNARPMHPDWVRSLRDQCAAAGVAFLFKQWGEWAPAGRLFDDGDTEETCAAETALEAGQVELRDGTLWTDPKRVQLVDRNMANWANDDAQPPHDVVVIQRVGKKRAGRALDGRTHDGFPDQQRRAA